MLLNNAEQRGYREAPRNRCGLQKSPPAGDLPGRQLRSHWAAEVPSHSSQCPIDLVGNLWLVGNPEISGLVLVGNFFGY